MTQQISVVVFLFTLSLFVQSVMNYPSAPFLPGEENVCGTLNPDIYQYSHGADLTGSSPDVPYSIQIIPNVTAYNPGQKFTGN